jgi:hypothetical protein
LKSITFKAVERPVRKIVPESAIIDEQAEEEPERWDGLS